MFAPLRMVVHVLLLYVNSLPSVPQSPSGEVESQEGEMLNGNLMLVVMSLRCYVISSFSIGQFNVRHYFKLVFNYWSDVFLKNFSGTFRKPTAPLDADVGSERKPRASSFLTGGILWVYLFW